jgi:outer membrane receptor protein involved in Fe transport
MKKQYLFLTLLGILMVQLGFAQEKTITGTVTDETGLPLPGATVVVENTTRGVSTDFDGNYSINATENEVLIFSFVGYTDQKITIGTADNYNISLQPGNQLEEVVVTSLGIKREKQALGYAVSEVASDALEQRAEGDVGRVLAGKASGVQITNQSGISGSGTSIVIRGFNTFSQGNQPLFIVDGIPFSSETNAVGRQGDRNDFVNSNNGSSRFLDIDPNNIESVNVLKGLAAATLYGTQGSHVKVTVDGKVTYYGIPSPYASDADRNAILEPYTGNDSSGRATLTIPEGAKKMSFEWASGDWPSECTYTIDYTNLDGTNEQTTISESNPTNGIKVLSICQ